VTSDVLCALDCGTNSTRLLIETAAGEVLSRQMRITRLGAGVDAGGSLADDAVDRSLRVLEEYRTLMDRYGVTAGRLVATSAARDASNGPAFLAEASAITGVDAEILSGDEEGRLSFLGAMADIEPSVGDDVVLDIGGGSSELVVDADGAMAAFSMQVGCVRLTERCLQSDPPSPGQLDDARAVADEALEGAIRAIPALGALRPKSRLVGLAGTVATLAQLELGLDDYDRSQVHHLWMDLDRIVEWTDDLAAEASATRALRPGMVPGREDVIVGGLIVLVASIERLGLTGCLTSESDILDGLILSLQGS